MNVLKKFTVTGPSAYIHQFASQMVDAPPAGWRGERRRPAFGKGITYVFVRPGDDIVQTSSVFMTAGPDETSISIDAIVPNRAGGNSRTQVHHIVDEFVAVATPVARGLGLHVELTVDVASARRWLSPEAVDALEGFSNGANKATGSSHPMDWDRWARFIVLAHREKTDLDGSAFTRLLVEDYEWPEEEAYKLGREYDIGRGVLESNDSMKRDHR